MKRLWKKFANGLCRFLAEFVVPKRFAYFVINQAVYETSFDDNFSHIPIQHIKAADVMEFIKPDYVP